MVLFALSGILVGVILGTQLAVVALIPVMLCATMAGVAWMAAGAAVLTTGGRLVLFLIALQIGYLAAAGGRAARDNIATGLRSRRSVSAEVAAKIRGSV